MSKTLDLIDFHAHILPGADHGSTDIECSKRQIELLSDVGIKRIVATPHFYPHKTTLKSFLSLREKSIRDIKQVLDVNSPEIYAAAEVLLMPGLDKMDGLEELCINGTNVILVELPVQQLDGGIEDALLNMRENGLVPVVAHIDRYEKEVRQRLVSLGLYCQINVSALCSLRRRMNIMPCVSDGAIYALGTDIHGTNEGFTENYVKGCKRLKQELNPIMERSAELLVRAEPIK